MEEKNNLKEVKKLINSYNKKMIKSLLTNEIKSIKHIYAIGVKNNANIVEELEVIDYDVVYYLNDKFLSKPETLFKNSVSRSDVENFKFYYEQIKIATPVIVYICSQEVEDSFYILKHIIAKYIDDKNYSYNRKNIEEIVNEKNEALKKFKEEREMKLNNGYVQCAYCGKYILKSEAIEKYVWINHSKDKEMFCSDECAKYREMGAEG